MSSKSLTLKIVAAVGVIAVPGVVNAAPRSEASAGRAAAAAASANGRQASALDAAPGGDAAIDALGSRVDALASQHGLTTAALKAELRHDNSLRVANGQLAVVDEAPADTSGGTSGGTAESFAAADTPGVDEAFTLHSRRGSDRVIYLDVDGHTTENTYWNTTGPIISDPWDLNGDPTTFNDTERAAIIAWWQQVADDFAAWDVDVTTEAPPIDSLQRTSPSDQQYGVRVVISPTNFYDTGAAGVAYLNSIQWDSDTPAFVFTQQSGANYTRNVADVAVHELGHAFNLRHDGTSTSGYYVGHGDWAPIMGYPLFRNVAQWSKGEYPDANNTEDDLAKIGSIAPLLADDHGDASQPSALELGASADGVIADRADVDSFAVPAAAGQVDIIVRPSHAYGALDAALTITDSTGEVIANVNTAGVGTETVSLAGDRGPFVVSVDGVGSADLVSGYSDYASIGAYRISVTGDPAVPPTTTPDTTVPDTTVPGTTVPDTTVPDTTVPDTTVPDTTVPATTEPPATTVPDTTVPDTTVPDTTVPDTTTPDTEPPTTTPPTTEPPTTTTTEPTTTTTQPTVSVRVNVVEVVASRRRAQARTRVETADGTAVPGALVVGRWSDGALGQSAAYSGDDGEALTRPRFTRSSTPTFTVSKVELPDGYQWDGVADVATAVAPPSVSVGSVEVTVASRRARARVAVVTADGTPVPGALIAGRWSDGARGRSAARTGADGVGVTGPRFTSSTTPTFTVTSVRLPDGYEWDGTEVAATAAAPTVVQVSTVEVSVALRRARAQVTVVTADGAPVVGARVVGRWADGARGLAAARTGTDGVGVTGPRFSSSTSPTFTVANVRLPDGYVWDGNRTAGTTK